MVRGWPRSASLLLPSSCRPARWLSSMFRGGTYAVSFRWSALGTFRCRRRPSDFDPCCFQCGVQATLRSVPAPLDGAADATVEVPAVAEVGQEGVFADDSARFLDLCLPEQQPPVEVPQPGLDARRHATHPKLES